MSTKNPTRICLGFNRDLHGEKSATDSQSPDGLRQQQTQNFVTKIKRSNKIAQQTFGARNPTKLDDTLYTLWSKFLVYTVFIFALICYCSLSSTFASQIRPTILCLEIVLGKRVTAARS
jgi:hypothetical protein